MYQKSTDKELFHYVKNNDMPAFKEIYERYHTVLYLYTVKRLHDNQESFDIVQDALMNIWVKRDSLEINSLKSYLFTTVRNKILDQYAHKQVAAKYLDSLEYMLTTVDNTDYKIREKDLEEIIEKEIGSMPARMKEIFILSRKEWLSNSEIADKLSLSKLTVETQVKRALKLLRLKLINYTHLFTLAYLFINFFKKN